MSRVTAQRRHNPLEQDIETTGGRLRTKSITGKRKSRSDENNDTEDYIDAKSSRKILALAQDQYDEDATERRMAARPVKSTTFDFGSRFKHDEEDDHTDTKFDEDDDWIPEDEEEEEEIDVEDLDPEQLAMFKKFLPAGDELADIAPSIGNLSTGERKPMHYDDEDHGEDADGEGQTTNLADLILQRIAEKEAMDAARAAGGTVPPQQQIMGGGAPDDVVEIPLRVVETFTKVGQLLSRYKSGPLPKPFKVLPTLPQWPELLSITKPETWTPNATYRATKIFISAPASTGQHFLNTVLLDRVREDIQETKKLNVHLYNSLKASFYRPAAFFKGFLFPLVESGCTLREAHIISSVLAKIKIPVLHSAAALLRLCEICAEQTSNINSEAAGSANIFIKILLGKKYALPYKVVDGLVFHFLRFRATKETNDNTTMSDINQDRTTLAAKEAKLPVLWHQSLLIFAQTYRNEITEDQREALLDLLLVRGHKDIGPEVRRELLAGRNRASDAEGSAIATSGTTMEIDHRTDNITGSNNVAIGLRDGQGQERDDGDDTMDIA